jgi:hypothetical protein
MNSRRRYPQPISNNTHPPRVELKNEVLGPVRSLKRKKSSSSVVVPGPSGHKGRNSETQRAENMALAAPRPYVSRRVFAQFAGNPTRAMGRPPLLGSNLPVRVSSKKDKGMTEETLKLPRDTHRHSNVDEADRQHSDIPAGRHFFTGPLAVAEHERMKKEIESLKETLHESRQMCRLQAKVITW